MTQNTESPDSPGGLTATNTVNAADPTNWQRVRSSTNPRLPSRQLLGE
jgi:hypothetical protein